MAEIQLLNNASATGEGVSWPSGKGVFTVYSATFAGASVKLQWSPDQGTTWLDVDRSGDNFTTLSAVGAGLFELPGCKIRALVTGGPPSAVFAKAISVLD